jgi:hypothetical protein
LRAERRIFQRGDAERAEKKEAGGEGARDCPQFWSRSGPTEMTRRAALEI